MFGLSGNPLLVTCCDRQCAASSFKVMDFGSRPPACGVWSMCQVPDSISPRIVVSWNSAAAFVWNVVAPVRLSPCGSVNLTWYLPDGNLRIDPSPLRVPNCPPGSCPIRAQCVPKLVEINCYSMVVERSDKSKSPLYLQGTFAYLLGAPPGT